MQAPTILLTGFEPFGGDAINPSWQVALAWHGLRIGPATVHAVQLPCVFGKALPALHAAMAATRPQLVLALGQAGGRCDLSIERVAINVDDARIADNAGAQPVDDPVVAGGRRRTSARCRSRRWWQRCGKAGCQPRCRRRQARSSATMCSTD